MTDAAIMTARMISITSIGGLVGVWPNTYVSTKTPKLPHNPRPTPPYRLPITIQASTTANSRQFTKVSIGHSFPYPPVPPHAKRRDASASLQDAMAPSLPSYRDHLPSEKGDLRRQWQVLRTHVVAAEQRQAAEDAVVITDELEIVFICAAVARVETEAGDFIEPHRADEIFTHAHCAATRDAAAALDAAVEFVDLFRQLRLHPFFQPAQISFLLLHVQPCFQTLAHPAHPFAGIHRQVRNQFEYRQRRQRDLRRQVLGQRPAGEGRTAVDDHAAAAADTGATDEVKLERRLLLFANLVERHKQRHPFGFIQLIGHHARYALPLLRVEAKNADLQLAGRGFIVHVPSSCIAA